MTASPKHSWPLVKLGAVLTPVERAEKVNAAASYRLLGVRLDGNGAFLRETVTGAQTSALTLYRVETDDFIFSRLFACRGAFGVIGPDLDGCHVSGEFPTFRPKLNAEGTAKIDVRYLRYWFRLPVIVATVNEQCTGSTPLTRNRFKEDKFLALEIPLPPLAEQHRLIARLDSLASRIAEARKLREEAIRGIQLMQASVEKELWPDALLSTAPTLESVTSFLARGRQSEQGESAHYLLKTQHVQMRKCLPTMLRLSETAAAKVKEDAKVKRGDVLIACSAAGCLGRVAQYDGNKESVSTDTHVAIARANPAVISPEYLYAYLAGTQGQHQLRSRERGDWQREKISFRLTELNLNDLRAVPIPTPSLAEQRRIVTELDALQAQVDALKRHQADSSDELDALLPALLDRAFKGEL